MTTEPCARGRAYIPNTRPSWLVGDAYPSTKAESLDVIAVRIHRAVLHARDEGLFPPEIGAEVTADTTLTPRVVSIHLACPQLPRYQTVIRSTMVTALELASFYNRADPADPSRARFMVSIAAVEDGVAYLTLMGTMFGSFATTGRSDDRTVVDSATHPADNMRG